MKITKKVFNQVISTDILLLMLSIIFILAILLVTNPLTYLWICFVAVLNVFLMKRLKLKLLFLFCLLMFMSTFGTFITGIIFAKSNSGVIVTILGINFVKSNLEIALNLALRSFCIGFLSFVFIIHIDFANAIMFAMQKLRLKPQYGFALLAVSNAFEYMRDEYRRIIIAKKFRGIKNNHTLAGIYSLLVSATRYAHLCGISLQCRGITNDRTFLKIVPSFGLIELIILLLNIVILSVIVII